MYKNVSELWKYLEAVLKLPTRYENGRFGQYMDGCYCYDCVCLIKSFPWCDGIAGKYPKYKKNNVKDDWIGALYQQATMKSTDINTVPNYGIWIVYKKNAHVAVYNATKGQIIEAAGKSVARVRKTSFNKNDWDKWSNLYWCGDVTPKSSPKKFNLLNVPVYKDAYSESIGTRTGVYYLWSGEIINGRVRMTNSPQKAGVKGQVSFYVDKSVAGLH